MADPDGPVSAAEFTAAMARLGPFEAAPRLAVAVSGGADSMALALLADEWARGRGGGIVALTVDHRLRRESADEASRVGGWLRARAISHVVLVREGEKPVADLQAAARAARYDLLGRWCRDAGVVHLLLAHHREDQAETLLLRLARGSGVDGLAAMAAVSETAALRLLRPLLDVSRRRLRATLLAAGQDWVEDPSNADSLFGRVRLRALAPALAAEGLTAARLAATARRLGRARAALEADAARAAARSVTLHPAGFARLDPAALDGAGEEVRLRVLTRLLACIGGGAYPLRAERLERLAEALAGGLAADRTLGGCLLTQRRGGLFVCREPAAVASPVALAAGAQVDWDGRFRVVWMGPEGVRLGALGGVGWAELRDAGVARPDWPAAALKALPAFYDHRGVSAVPHLRYKRREDGRARVEFAPRTALTAAGHCLV